MREPEENALEANITAYLRNHPFGKEREEIYEKLEKHEREKIDECLERMKENGDALQIGDEFRWKGQR